MKVKEYLVNRILDLEKDLKQVKNEKAGTTYGLQKLQDDVIKLNEKLEQYQIEREHIKQIITCNIVEDVYVEGRYEIDLNSNENDFKTLQAILDIKPKDYKPEDIKPMCNECLYEDTAGDVFPCSICHDNSEFIEKGGDTDAKTTD